MTERCEVARCRAEVNLTYLGHGICDRHWEKFTAEDVGPEALRMALGIDATTPTAREDTTMKPTPSKTTKPESAAAAKNSKPAKQAKPKAAKEPKQAKAPKETLVVFAFRIPKAQRDLIHKAAGPRNASRFVIDAAIAAARARLK